MKIIDALNTLKQSKHEQAQLNRNEYEADRKRKDYKNQWARRKKQRQQK